MNVKYIVGIGAIALLAGGAYWYTSMDMGHSMMDMDGMMGGEIKEADNLSILHDENVPTVQSTEVVELKDGDTYEMVASVVKQEVGNRTVKRLAYNGQIPGPVLKASRGAKVTINFVNNLDMETALHSHGLRGDYRMDGAAPLTQDPIPVGGTFVYELEFPDTGVFWYHPHVREDYQQDMGLYGNFIVTEDGYWNDVDQEAYLIVDDVLEDGEYSKEVVTNTLMGRFGDTLLINDQTDFNLDVKQGEITRAFITNVANTRTFNLEFPGAQMKLVGGDTGRIEQEKIITNQIIGTSERYVIELYYDTPGVYPIVHRGKT
jgi:FtsP/CotA-like multicopper oxidase with cupredoxin domain